MRHRLQWSIQQRAHGLDREMRTPPTLSCEVWPIYLYLLPLPSFTFVAVGDYDAGLVVWLGALPVTTTTPVTSRHTDQQPVLTASSSSHEIHG